MEGLLRELVERSSWTRDRPGVNACGDVLRRAMPLPCTAVASERFGDHLFFHGPRRGSEGGVVLVGHHDTVFPRERFEGMRVDGDIARGPGVLDMKGGLVVVVFALRALEEVGLLDALAVTVAVVADEEVGSPESAALLREAARGARCSLVFEAGRAGDAIITRRKGTGAATITAHGRAAHAGNHHHLGANAIRAMARFVVGAEGLTDYARGVTVNVGRIEGGIGKNTVPDRCTAELDLRFETRADGESLCETLRSLAGSHGVEGVWVEVDAALLRSPLERTPESAALRDRYADCQRAAGLGDGEAGLIGGGSDASTTCDAGVPSIDGLGPRGEGFHTLDERVELSSLVPKSEALMGFLLGCIDPEELSRRAGAG